MATDHLDLEAPEADILEPGESIVLLSGDLSRIDPVIAIGSAMGSRLTAPRLEIEAIVATARESSSAVEILASLALLLRGEVDRAEETNRRTLDTIADELKVDRGCSVGDILAAVRRLTDANQPPFASTTPAASESTPRPHGAASSRPLASTRRE